MKCDACGSHGRNIGLIYVTTMNGGVCFCRQCLDDVNRKNPALAEKDAEITYLKNQIEETWKPRCVSRDAEITRLQAFKDWVHAYLDQKDIPANPGGPHSKKGCRIGDRMDLVFAEIARLRATVRELVERAEQLGKTSYLLVDGRLRVWAAVKAIAEEAKP